MEFNFGRHGRRDEEEEQPYPPPGHHHPLHHHGHPPPPSCGGGGPEELDGRPEYPNVQHVSHEGGFGYGEHRPNPPPSNYYEGGTGEGYGRHPPYSSGHGSGAEHSYDRPPSYSSGCYGGSGGEENYERPPPHISGGHHPGGHEGWAEDPSRSRQPTVRIFTRADENYSLSIRDGKVILVPNDPSDQYQHWIKDLRYSTKVKDAEGFPSFALINKVTGEAIKHSIGATHPVRLVPYNPNYLDESVLWSESKDIANGFRCIRMVNNIGLNFDAFHGDKDHGGVRDGTTIVLWEWLKGNNQQWKIVPYYFISLMDDSRAENPPGKDAKLNLVISNGTWAVPVPRLLGLPAIYNRITNIPVDSTAETDVLCWKRTKLGDFSVRTG